MDDALRIDLGCGAAKKPGFIGLDFVPGPEVDHVLDLTRDRYPFDDATVDEVFSSHFLEHIEEPNHVFKEIARVAKDGARLEFWMPYGFTHEALLYGHLHSFTELDWLHFCVHHRDAHADMLGGRWLLEEIIFIVMAPVADEIRSNGFSLDFAIKYFKDVVAEFGVRIEFRRDLSVPAVEPVRSWAESRDAPRHPLLPEAPEPAVNAEPDPAPEPGPAPRPLRSRVLGPARSIARRARSSLTAR